MSHENDLLHVAGLTVSIKSRTTSIVPVQNVSLSARRGEIVGIVGESGCGKSTLLRAIAGVLPRGATATSGELRIAGSRVKLGALSPTVAMVFQDPMTGLNPVRTVGEQVCEVPRRRDGVSKSRASEMAVDLLAEVGIPDAERRLGFYPHQLSGGLRQRVLIAAALSGNPDLLLCDEPTTALDVTIQAQFVGLLQRLVRERGLGIVYVTHDLPLLGTMCDYINVMYAAEIVERGPTDAVLQQPKHPYTAALLNAAPRLDDTAISLKSIPGRPPMPTGAATAPLLRALPAREAGVRHCHRSRHDRGRPRVGMCTSGRPGTAWPARRAMNPVVELVGLRVVHGALGRRGRRGSSAQDRETVAIDGIDLTLSQGQILGIVGESGSGKTSVARCVAGFQEPTSGQVLIDGKPATAKRPRRERRRVQMIFQDPYSSLNPSMTLLQAIPSQSPFMA